MNAFRIFLVALQYAAYVYAAVKRLYWTTDDSGWREPRASFGPDGPWQAVWVGGYSTQPAWPTGAIQSMMLSTRNGGTYNNRSSDFINNEGPGLYGVGSWPVGLRTGHRGVSWGDLLYFDYAGESRASRYQSTIHGTVWMPDEYPDSYFRGANTTQPVGILGLGKDNTPEGIWESTYELPLVPMDQLFLDGEIKARSWYMHMGSVPLDQPGSLTLGGYEQNRVLGDVGAFTLDEELPLVFLVDVALGFETGESPFDSNVGSVWQGINHDERAQNLVKKYGGTFGSAMVVPNAAVPYIYLPLGVCEAAASHLPVTWNPRVGLYLWDFRQQTRAERLVNSPAYMSFIFSDQNARNITIKIPFKLLNLTLDDMPGRDLHPAEAYYWPCKPWNANDPNATPAEAESRWQLGRAFLQGAFTGFNYDRKRFYMAQAPGPGMGQRVMVDDDSETIKSKPGNTFAETWQHSWTAIESAEEPSSTPGSKPLSTGGLRTGEKAGIAIGAVCGAVAAVACVWFFFCRAQGEKPEDGHAKEADVFTGGKSELGGEGVKMSELAHEARSPEPEAQAVFELSSPVAHELPTPSTPLMNDCPSPFVVVHELPGNDMGSHDEEGNKYRRTNSM